MYHACPADNLDYSAPMKKFCTWMLLVLVLAAVAGCKTHSGSREYIPGKGWIHTD